MLFIIMFILAMGFIFVPPSRNTTAVGRHFRKKNVFPRHIQIGEPIKFENVQKITLKEAIARSKK